MEAELCQQPKKTKRWHGTLRGRLSKDYACNLSGTKMLPQNPQRKAWCQVVIWWSNATFSSSAKPYTPVCPQLLLLPLSPS